MGICGYMDGHLKGCILYTAESRRCFSQAGVARVCQASSGFPTPTSLHAIGAVRRAGRAEQSEDEEETNRLIPPGIQKDSLLDALEISDKYSYKLVFFLLKDLIGFQVSLGVLSLVPTLHSCHLQLMQQEIKNTPSMRRHSNDHEKWLPSNLSTRFCLHLILRFLGRSRRVPMLTGHEQ